MVLYTGSELVLSVTKESTITQQLADKLHLLPTSHKTISVSSFGAQISPSRTLAVATILVHTLNGTRIQISVLIVLRTCRTYQKCACSLACYPSFAEPSTCSPGNWRWELWYLYSYRADYYWHFIQDYTVRGNGPTTVQSKLGRLLSSPPQLPQPMGTCCNLALSYVSLEVRTHVSEIVILPIARDTRMIISYMIIHTFRYIEM